MTFYLLNLGEPVNGLQIKERYGKDFRRQKKYQNIPRYVVYKEGQQVKEFSRLKSAAKFIKEQTS